MFQRKLMAFFVVALLAVTAGVSQASLSRMEGMGLTVPALSQFTDDYANIYYYPTSVVRQNNLVLAELGNNPGGAVNAVSFNDQSLTLIKNFPHFGSLAYQMKQSALNSNFSNNLQFEQFDVIWGMGLEKIDIGVRVDATNSSLELDTSAGPTHAEAHGIGGLGDPYPFGAVFVANRIVNSGIQINTWGVTPAIALHLSNDNRLEGAVGFRRYSLDHNISTAGVAGEQWKDGGNLSYAVNIRGIMHEGDRATWYPAFWYVNDDLSYEVTNNNVAGVGKRSADETYKTYGVGLSHNMRVNDNNLLIFGVAATQTKNSYARTDNNDGVVSAANKTTEFKNTQAPLFFASLETDITKWLKGRIGASKAMLNQNLETTDFGAPTVTVTQKARLSSFNFSLGTGVRFNNFDLDMTLNNAFPLSGGYILSGDQATPFTRVSGTYHY